MRRVLDSLIILMAAFLCTGMTLYVDCLLRGMKWHSRFPTTPEQASRRLQMLRSLLVTVARRMIAGVSVAERVLARTAISRVVSFVVGTISRWIALSIQKEKARAKAKARKVEHIVSLIATVLQRCAGSGSAGSAFAALTAFSCTHDVVLLVLVRAVDSNGKRRLLHIVTLNQGRLYMDSGKGVIDVSRSEGR